MKFCRALTTPSPSRSYLVDLLPSALLFIIATSLFIFGLGLDVLEIRDNARKASARPREASKPPRTPWR